MVSGFFVHHEESISYIFRVRRGLRTDGCGRAWISWFRGILRSGNNLNFMRRFHKILLGLLIGSTAYAADPPAHFYTPSRDSVMVLEEFEYPGQLGRFPSNWEGRVGWRQKKTKKKEDLYYTIQAENGDHFLRAETVGRATNAGRPEKINLRIWKKLRWRWRVHRLPAGGNENHKKTNDSAAAVRLVFGSKSGPRRSNTCGARRCPRARKRKARTTKARK